MPGIFIHPSYDDQSMTAIGMSAKYYARLLADEMAPLLDSAGIPCVVAPADGTDSSAVWLSNAGSYNLHLALSFGATHNEPNTALGAEILYFPSSKKGFIAAERLSYSSSEISS